MITVTPDMALQVKRAGSALEAGYPELLVFDLLKVSTGSRLIDRSSGEKFICSSLGLVSLSTGIHRYSDDVNWPLEVVST